MALYKDLPAHVYENATKIGLKSKIKVEEDFTSSFLQQHLPAGRLLKGEDKDLRYKTQNLESVKKKKRDVPVRRKRKGLSSKEKRALKLFEIKKEGQRYDKYLPMHRMWKDYIREVINPERISESNIQVSQDKLLKADYHGSCLTVQRSKCPSFVGVTGIVLQETKNTFKLITKENQVKCIPKMNSVFAVEIDGYLFTIYGNQFRVKTGDRSTRKFKMKGTVEMHKEHTVIIIKQLKMSDSENEEEVLLRRHKNEKKELQAKIQQLKHSVSKGDKKKKKDVAEQIAKFESELKEKQESEIKELKEKSEKGIEDRLGALQTNDNEDESPLKTRDETQECTKEKKLSKAQRRREKQAAKNKDREERIKEQELLNLTGARHIEFTKIKSLLKEKNLQIYEIPSDGNCLYNAISHQLPGETYETLRRKTAQYMKDNPDEFLPFLTKENGDPYSQSDFEEFLQKTAETTEWGGQLEVRAMSHALHQPVEIVQGEGPSIKIGEEFGSDFLTVCYHRHAFGLGEHYNSVEPYVEEESEFS